MPLVVLFKSESVGPDKFIKALDEKNFHCLLIFCLDFQFKNLDLLRMKLENHQDYEGLLLTSPRSLSAIEKAAKDHNEILKNWKNKSNYCVGETTSHLAQSMGLQSKGKQAGNAFSLSKILIEDLKENMNLKRFLFPSGNLKQDLLEKSLEEGKIKVENIEVYETIQHEKLEDSIEELKVLKVDYIIYFSPSGVNFSLPLLRKRGINVQDIKIIAIGPSTKKSLEDNGLHCYRMCPKPSPESLLEALS